jgi:hypothetical protein
MPRDSSRLQKELKEIAADPKSGVTARVKDEADLSHLQGTIQGARAPGPSSDVALRALTRSPPKRRRALLDSLPGRYLPCVPFLLPLIAATAALMLMESLRPFAPAA